MPDAQLRSRQGCGSGSIMCTWGKLSSSGSEPRPAWHCWHDAPGWKVCCLLCYTLGTAQIHWCSSLIPFRHCSSKTRLTPASQKRLSSAVSYSPAWGADSEATIDIHPLSPPLSLPDFPHPQPALQGCLVSRWPRSSPWGVWAWVDSLPAIACFLWSVGMETPGEAQGIPWNPDLLLFFPLCSSNPVSLGWTQFLCQYRKSTLCLWCIGMKHPSDQVESQLQARCLKVLLSKDQDFYSSQV